MVSENTFLEVIYNHLFRNYNIRLCVENKKKIVKFLSKFDNVSIGNLLIHVNQKILKSDNVLLLKIGNDKVAIEIKEVD